MTIWYRSNGRAGPMAPWRNVCLRKGFYTPNRRAKFLSVAKSPIRNRLARPIRWCSIPALSGSVAHHDPNRSGAAPIQPPNRALLELHPDDGEKYGVTTGDLAEVTSRVGRYIARPRSPDRCTVPGEAFLPMHWNKMFANKSVIGDVVPGHLDPYSGQPASKSVAVTVKAYAPTWQGILITKTNQDLPELSLLVPPQSHRLRRSPKWRATAKSKSMRLLAHLDAQLMWTSWTMQTRRKTPTAKLG